MQIKGLLKDDSAVSPVIGVILMVAITVILAAVIATFVLGLGDSVSNTTPQASFSFDFDSTTASATADLTGSDGTNGGDLTITHDGGDTIDHNLVSVKDDDGDGPVSPFSSELSAGSSVDVQVGQDDTIRVIYEGESGDSSSTLAKWSGPDA